MRAIPKVVVQSPLHLLPLSYAIINRSNTFNMLQPLHTNSGCGEKGGAQQQKGVLLV